jgi:hypothetical protein
MQTNVIDDFKILCTGKWSQSLKMQCLFRLYKFKKCNKCYLWNIVLQVFKCTLHIQARKQNHCIQITVTKY